jgi:hypothetical protein
MVARCKHGDQQGMVVQHGCTHERRQVADPWGTSRLSLHDNKQTTISAIRCPQDEMNIASVVSVPLLKDTVATLFFESSHFCRYDTTASTNCGL